MWTLISSFFQSLALGLGLISKSEDKQAGIDAQKAADLGAQQKEEVGDAEIDDADAGLTRQQLIAKLHNDGAGKQ